MAKLTVATTFPVHPPRGGGQKRILHLWGELARASGYEVEIVALGQPHSAPARREVAPGVVETRVPKSLPHDHREKSFERAVETIVTDVAMPLLYDLTPGYLEALSDAAADSEAVVASHPYTLPAIRAACDRPLWYEAHNVELDLKGGVLRDGAVADELLNAVRQVERGCCEEADVILAASADDAARLGSLYGARLERFLDAPNGVDSDRIRFVAGDERAELKRRIGAEDDFTAVFMGSWHPPNLEALEVVLELATRAAAGVRFLVLGMVGAVFKLYELPPAVDVAGEVPEGFKDDALAVSDVGLNPMLTGSGTNLKILEYLAAGLPALSTPVGARGLGLEDGRHLTIADAGEFGERIAEAQDEPRDAREARVRAARAEVEERFSWRSIAEGVVRDLRERGRLEQAA